MREGIGGRWKGGDMRGIELEKVRFEFRDGISSEEDPSPGVTESHFVPAEPETRARLRCVKRPRM